MLVSYIGERMTLIININNDTKEHTRGNQCLILKYSYMVVLGR